MSYIEDSKKVLTFALDHSLDKRIQINLLDEYRKLLLGEGIAELNGVLIDLGDYELQAAKQAGKRIEHIRRLRELSGACLKEAKELSDELLKINR